MNNLLKFGKVIETERDRIKKLELIAINQKNKQIMIVLPDEYKFFIEYGGKDETDNLYSERYINIIRKYIHEKIDSKLLIELDHAIKEFLIDISEKNEDKIKKIRMLIKEIRRESNILTNING